MFKNTIISSANSESFSIEYSEVTFLDLIKYKNIEEITAYIKNFKNNRTDFIKIFKIIAYTNHPDINNIVRVFFDLLYNEWNQTNITLFLKELHHPQPSVTDSILGELLCKKIDLFKIVLKSFIPRLSELAREEFLNRASVREKTLLSYTLFYENEELAHWLCVQGAKLKTAEYTAYFTTPVSSQIISPKIKMVSDRSSAKPSKTFTIFSNELGHALKLSIETPEQKIIEAILDGKVATPIDQALLNKYIKKITDINTRHLGETFLTIAAYNNQTDWVDFLLAHGADIELTNGKGSTPLLLACSQGYTDIAKTLLKHGANYETKNKKGETPLLLANEKNYQDIITLIETYSVYQQSNAILKVCP